MRILGKQCTLTVAKDDEYFPLPYSEETVRETSKGYVLPGVIGKRNREKFIRIGSIIEGCFVTFLDYSCCLALFLLFFYENECFDIYADRVFERTIYKNVCLKGFELRAKNGEAFKLRVDIGSTDNSYTTGWPVNIPALKHVKTKDFTNFAGSSLSQFYRYDGHRITINDGKTIPLVYRIELVGKYGERTEFSISLYFPLSTEFFPEKKVIEKLTIPVNIKDGICIDLYDLEVENGLTDINCADTVLSMQKFKINGCVVFRIRNENEYFEIVL